MLIYNSVERTVYTVIYIYITTSASSIYKRVVSIFSWNDYQKDTGNMPHTDSMLEVEWVYMSE